MYIFSWETQSNTGVFLSDKKEYRTQKVVVATVYLMVRIIYRMFSDASRYQELGERELQEKKTILTLDI
ncbi:hypothetical protein IW492_02345 [Enterococcus sp. BWB1-3]|uniref:hypothetical protein n=1 Tax=Enterococcus sp. BWB1-3 TaxID=2787713 RepID=UPI001923C634|nr:hypothetical protein [Enterococcus sp. BWB1-3]MBL1228071.1 hypothetical protein [Enterococcus sp. BWB1-3]